MPIPWIDETSGPDVCNLTVTDIKMEPVNPKAGDTVIFYATVKNTGKKDSKNPSLRFFVDDYIASWAVFSSPFKPGESNTVSSINQDKQFVWHAASGTHTITVQVDPQNTMSETSKKDNTKSIKFLIP